MSDWESTVKRSVAGPAVAAIVGLLALGGAVVAGTPAVAASQATAVRTVSSSARSALPALAWPAYLDGPRHASYNPSQTRITPANASTLALKWRFTRGEPYVASPTVAGGAVYIGSARGWFYKLSERTGKVLAKVYIGRQPALTCAANGVTSTATVAADPANRVMTVYVAGGNGYLYALRASNLSREWRSVIAIPSTKVNDFYDWSSPTVANGKIYIGVASSCDIPLIRGAVLAFRQSSGAKLAEFHTVPPGPKHAGGSVWSSIAIGGNGDVYASTGNGPEGHLQEKWGASILKLDPDSLKLLGAFQVPKAQATYNDDFGGSPVVFGRYVGACDKNGIFYAVNQRTMKLAWSARIAAPLGGTPECLAAPVYNGRDLFFGGQRLTIGLMTYRGSVQERLAATGRLIWETGLPGGVIGSLALDGGGVLTAGTYLPRPSGIYLLNAHTGAVIDELTAGMTFAQSVFAGNRIFTADNRGVAAWGLPAG